MARPGVSQLWRAFSTHPQESFMSGSNSVYVEEMYRAWLSDKKRCDSCRR
jgi:2-oxoglutarate dehydrogenase complex dehydrogenase (E1) component-like enzyme